MVANRSVIDAMNSSAFLALSFPACIAASAYGRKMSSSRPDSAKYFAVAIVF